MCESRAQSLGRGDISEVAYVEICILNASARRARDSPALPQPPAFQLGVLGKPALKP